MATYIIAGTISPDATGTYEDTLTTFNGYPVYARVGGSYYLFRPIYSDTLLWAIDTTVHDDYVNPGGWIATTLVQPTPDAIASEQYIPFSPATGFPIVFNADRQITAESLSTYAGSSFVDANYVILATLKSAALTPGFSDLLGHAIKGPDLVWFEVQFDSGIAYNAQLDSVVADRAEVEGERYP